MTVTAAEFLLAFGPQVSVTSIAINASGNKGKVETTARTNVDCAKLESFLQSLDGRANAYFSVNATATPKQAKATNDDIALCRAAHVDIDARVGESADDATARGIAALQAYDPQPSIVVASGGGVQGFWLFDEPTPDKARVTQINRQLAADLGGDKCFDVSRIMRVPNLMNLPDAAKIKKGRVPARARVVEWHPERRYPLDALRAMPVEQPVESSPSRQMTRAMRRAIPKDVQAILNDGHGTEHNAGHYDQLVMGALVRVGFSLDEIKALWRASPMSKGSDQWPRGFDGELQRLFDNTPKPVWREVNKQGFPLVSFHNARAGIIKLGITVKHDTFHNIITVAGHDASPLVGELSDAVLSALRTMFSDVHGFDVGASNVFDAVQALANENRFDPVCDMLDEAQTLWEADKVARLDRLAPDYFNTEDSELNRAVMRRHVIAAVRRARQPGCKYDVCVVLESAEGWNKSSAIRILAGDENFSDESILNARGKDIMEALGPVWMHENADMAGMRKADVDAVKAHMSRQTDMHRPAYGRVVVRQPRHSIEWGTTNDSRYLQSQTGNRRFAPMKVLAAIDLEKLARDRPLILGEAAHYESQGESLVIPESLWPVARAEADKRRECDPWEELLADLPDDIIHTSGDGREVVASGDIMRHALRLEPGHMTSVHGRRLAQAMSRCGWQRTQSDLVKINGRTARGYWRFAQPERRDPIGGLL